MEIIYEQTPKAQARRICEIISEDVARFRKKHMDRLPVKIFITSDLVRVLWMASDDGDEFLRLLEVGGIRIAGVPVRPCKGLRQAYYLAEREMFIHIKGGFEDDQGEAERIPGY